MHRIDEKDPHLWEMAKERAKFKQHVFTYIVVCTFFWIIYFISGNDHSSQVPWPIWPMVGWGIGLAFHYFKAYEGSKDHLAEKEYEKMKRNT